MLVRSVLMIKLVLDQAGQFSKFGQISSEKSHLVHGPEDWRDVSALVEDFKKSFVDMFVF